MDFGHSPHRGPISPEPVIDLDQVLDKFTAARLIKPLIRPLAARTLRLDRFCKDVADWERAGRNGSTFEALFRLHSLTINILSGDAADLAYPGPLIVVSNHPFGILEALVLGRLAEAAGRYPKILATEFLTRIRPLQRFLIAVDSFGRRRASPRKVDGGLTIGDRSEDAALETPPGELGKGAVNGVEPGRRGGCELERPAGKRREPFAHLGKHAPTLPALHRHPRREGEGGGPGHLGASLTWAYASCPRAAPKA